MTPRCHMNAIDPLHRLGAKVEPKPAPVVAVSKVYDWRCATASDKPMAPLYSRVSLDVARYLYVEFGCF